MTEIRKSPDFIGAKTTLLVDGNGCVHCILSEVLLAVEKGRREQGRPLSIREVMNALAEMVGDVSGSALANGVLTRAEIEAEHSHFITEMVCRTVDSAAMATKGSGRGNN